MLVKRFVQLCFHIYVCLVVAYLCNAQHDRNPIELRDGAYTNILIAIDKNIEEDPLIIDSIKDIFRDGSSVLFSATNRRVYFGEITILIPLTWSRKPEYQVARLEAFENANVLVTSQGSNHRPYVHNPYQCGRQGLYMHLSKTFLTDEDIRNEFGTPGKVITRQFAKLRWGVFDEDYVSGTDAEAYYQSNAIDGGLEGTRCSSEVRGVIEDDNGDLCDQPDPFGNLPESCMFVPDHSDDQTAKASLMFASHIQSIDMFCDNEQGEPGFHNYEAPNLQNLKCDYQSIWEVMRKSDDFRYETSPPLPDGTNVSPNFTLVQPGGSLRMVLILDTSGSMNGERFEKMILGAKNFIQSVTPNGSYVGIVEFASSASVLSYMTEIIEDASRELLISRLPPNANGGTCIGCGLLKGIEVAQYNGMDSQGAYLILLSDGQENNYPYIADTIDDIKISGVIVHTIAFYQADTQMEELADMTGGISATCADGGSAQCVISAFTAIIAQRPQSVATSAPVQVQSSAIQLYPYAIQTTDALIDESLGLDTVMTFTWALNTMISITVNGPDGTFIDETDSRYKLDGTSKLITITILEAQAGVWDIEISNTGSYYEYVSVEVNSKPRSEDVYPPVVYSFLGTSFVNFTKAPLVEMYASVHVNYAPVYDATVIAEVDSASTGDVTTILLLDNGRGADLLAGDGIYSAYFLNFSSNGRYGFKVDVKGTTTTSSNSPMRRKRDAVTETPPTSASPSPGFRRTSNAGVVQVVNYSPDLNIDILIPSKITDIASMERTYDENRNVTLTWTAVGDDLDQGTAAYYELRFSVDFTQIRTNFTSSTEITNADLLLGNLSQVASSGTLESITIRLPGNQSDDMYSFMIRAWDEAGNAGPLSNIVSISRRPLPTTTMPTTVPTTMPISTAEAPTENLPTWAIVTICVACLLVLIFAITVIVVCVKRAKKNRVDISKTKNDHENNPYEHNKPEYEEPKIC